MTYDGRYRLGCEGVLYILLELFQPNEAFENAFSECLNQRKSFEIHSFFQKKEGVFSGIGSVITLDSEAFSIQGDIPINTNPETLSIFKQKLPPCFRLIIVGAEHDAVQLCKYASLTGWELVIVAGPKESKSIDNFPGATEFYAVLPEDVNVFSVDNQTA